MRNSAAGGCRLTLTSAHFPHSSTSPLVARGFVQKGWAGSRERACPTLNLLRPVEEGTVQGRPQAIPETGQPHSAGDRGKAAQALARQPARDSEVAGKGHRRLAQLLRRTRERPLSGAVRAPMQTAAHACPAAKVPTGPHRVGGYQSPHCCPLAQGQHPSSVAEPAACRQDLREEPDANSARPDLCGGTGATRFPTAICYSVISWEHHEISWEFHHLIVLILEGKPARPSMPRVRLGARWRRGNWSTTIGVERESLGEGRCHALQRL